MSKPMTRLAPDISAVLAIPTIPPAGPDSVASLPWKRAPSISPPELCINSGADPEPSAALN